MDARAGKEVHDLINFVGLRAQATAVGLIQLTTELAKAGVLKDDAVTRIKAAIADELELSRPSTVSKAEFDRTTRRRLDRLFAGDEKLGSGPAPGEHSDSATGQTRVSS